VRRAFLNYNLDPELYYQGLIGEMHVFGSIHLYRNDDCRHCPQNLCYLAASRRRGSSTPDRDPKSRTLA
jgi:hypothetical protein